MRIPEKGVIYRASPRAFIGNYLLAAGVVVLATLVVTSFGIGFTLFPASIGEMLNTLVYFAFAAVVAFLFEEPYLEGMMRYYAISNSEVVKVEGILRKRRHAIPYQSVAEVKVVKGLFGRLFNYGSVEVAGFKETGIFMNHMSDPEEIQRIVQHRVNSMRSALTEGGAARFRGRKENKNVEPSE